MSTGMLEYGIVRSVTGDELGSANDSLRVWDRYLNRYLIEVSIDKGVMKEERENIFGR